MSVDFEELWNVEARRSFLAIIGGESDWRTSLAQECGVTLETADRLALAAIARELMITSIKFQELEESQQAVNRLTGGLVGGLLGFSKEDGDEETPDDDEDPAQLMALARRTGLRIREGAGLTS